MRLWAPQVKQREISTLRHLGRHNATRYARPDDRQLPGSRYETIWAGRRARRLPSDVQDVALRKLRLINSARRIDDLKVQPGNRLEALKGSRAGQHSIRINDQWRICFVWRDGHAHDVEIVDYH
jgi:proteic killer suppression protein